MGETSYDAIVIGAGFAGVRAARDLRDAGRSVLLLEARDRLGGRTWSRPFTGTGRNVELGGTWIAPKFHPHIAEEIARYDFKLAESHAGPVRFSWSFGGRFGSTFPVEDDDVYDLERALFRVIEASHRIDRTVPRDQQDLADLDISVAEYLDNLGLGPTARRFLDGWAALGSGADPEEWSMLTALSLIASMDNSVWGWYAAVAEKFAVGTGGVLERLVDDSAPDVELSTPVARIEHGDDDVRVTTRDGREYAAGVAVLAAPLNTWNDIEISPGLSAVKREAATRGHRGRMRKLWVRVEGAPDDVIGFGLDAKLLWLSSEYALDDGSQLMVAFSAPENGFAPRGATDIEAAVREYAPGARLLEHDGHDWAADPFAKGTWMVNPPGMLSAHATELQRPEGRLHFAGADLATRWIGWMDGALETGARAALSIISQRDRAPAPPAHA